MLYTNTWQKTSTPPLINLVGPVFGLFWGPTSFRLDLLLMLNFLTLISEAYAWLENVVYPMSAFSWFIMLTDRMIGGIPIACGRTLLSKGRLTRDFYTQLKNSQFPELEGIEWGLIYPPIRSYWFTTVAM